MMASSSALPKPADLWDCVRGQPLPSTHLVNGEDAIEFGHVVPPSATPGPGEDAVVGGVDDCHVNTVARILENRSGQERPQLLQTLNPAHSQRSWLSASDARHNLKSRI